MVYTMRPALFRAQLQVLNIIIWGNILHRLQVRGFQVWSLLGLPCAHSTGQTGILVCAKVVWGWWKSNCLKVLYHLLSGITAEVLVVSSFDELYKRTEEAKGKIVVYNQPYISYGETVRYRAQGAVEAAKAGAVASLIRSITPFSINR